MVTLHNLDDNTTRSVVTDDNGGFLFENLKPGNYTVSASKEGFAASPTMSRGIGGPPKRARRSARCPSAQVQQTVKVEAAAEQINTENATVGDTRGHESTGRDAAELPGANHQSAGCAGAFPEHHHG